MPNFDQAAWERLREAELEQSARETLNRILVEGGIDSDPEELQWTKAQADAVCEILSAPPSEPTEKLRSIMGQRALTNRQGNKRG
jgi:hypothetical protein